MLRPSHLPPRCPLQSRSLSGRALDSSSQSTRRDGKQRSQHHRFLSQCTLLEEQPLWLDDLLTDSESSPKGDSLRRSSSDPVTILQASAAFQSLVLPAIEENDVSIAAPDKSLEPLGLSGTGLEASCVYGPNSPRQKNISMDSRSSIVTALLESVPGNPLQFIDEDFPGGFNINEFNVNGDVHAGACEDFENASRRRSGQRSRVRKIQYIAELERTVDYFQNLAADLAAGVASHFQQHAALSVENKKLKQQIAILQQNKLIKDGQYLSLRNEVEKLKVIRGGHRRSKSAASCLEGGSPQMVNSGTSWQMLDMGRLSLGGIGR